MKMLRTLRIASLIDFSMIFVTLLNIAFIYFGKRTPSIFSVANSYVVLIMWVFIARIRRKTLLYETGKTFKGFVEIFTILASALFFILTVTKILLVDITTYYVLQGAIILWVLISYTAHLLLDAQLKLEALKQIMGESK